MSEQTVTMNGALPVLVIQFPECEHCGLEVDPNPDGGATCGHCRVTWAKVVDGAAAESIDVDLGVCGLVVETDRLPWTADGKTFTPGPAQPCILPANHGERAGCLNPYDVVITEAPS